MEIITELDGYQAALSQINMNESVMPYVNGRLVSANAYNKVQKLLNCPEMIASHKYLYNLDLDQLSEDEECKIDQLYKLGCDRGFIIDDLTKYDDNAETPENSTPSQTEVEFKENIPCWTVIYSATDKNGNIKTGEAYSNAISSAAAKADVNSKLSQIGYSNITILAIEQCETPVAENDMLNNRNHNNHISIPEADDEEDSDESDDSADEEEDTDDAESDDSDEETTDTDDTNDEDSDVSGDDDSDDASSDDEDTEGGEDTESDEDSDDENSDDKKEDDSDEDDSDEDDSDEDDSDEDSDDEKEDDSDEDDSDEDSDDEDSDEEKEELDANKKAELKDKYRRVFKNTLVKCKFDTSFNELTLEQKVKFFTALSKAWTKNEPNEFMTDKEIEQLNNVVVKEND